MNTMARMFNVSSQEKNFDSIRISIASPERIRAWSFGEVKRSETINYLTSKPEKDGLFCAKIFGPVKDYECLCEKYKRIKYKGVVCEKCGVEVALSKVRRERMGHVELASPVVHIWFLKSLPSRIGLLVDMVLKDLEAVLYFEKYIVLEPGLTDLKYLQLLTEEEFLDAQDAFGSENFTAKIGAEALDDILSKMDLKKELEKSHEELKTKSEVKRKKIIKRLKLIKAFQESGTRPEWMILKNLPVIPPELRPLVPFDGGGRFIVSDLNDLYRRVINRNNRLKRLLLLNAPDIIIRNEKRMLQVAVDALFDNGRCRRVFTGKNKNRPLKSLSDMIKGKQGRFRQNLLGKRVDYSGRSVIVVGPELKLHQCGLPKKIALEIFRPFVYSKLELRGIAPTIKVAKQMVDKEHPEVWEALDEIIREHPVLLNRAPTLHRLGIQAFEPILIEGKAITLHPLVCTAFNADFDGDQMAVHVPLSLEAQLEARVLMMSTNNILSPSSGKPIIVPSQDIILGLYYLSLQENNPSERAVVTIDSGSALSHALKNNDVTLHEKDGTLVEEKNVKSLLKLLREKLIKAYRVQTFATIGEVEHALAEKTITLHAPIKALYKTVDKEGNAVSQKVVTTVGRMLLAEIYPRHYKLPFAMINTAMTKKEVSKVIDAVYRHCGAKQTVIFCDKLMELGFKWACHSGVSFSKSDMIVPTSRDTLIKASEAKVSKFERQYQEGLITQGEKYNKVIDVWSSCTDKVAEEMMREMSEPDPKRGLNSIYMMAVSGARGSIAQMKQLSGMRGLMTKPSGEIIETPIKSNFKEGLNVLEYYTSAHGARKGSADTSLKTSNSGYLTRRLVDVAQDVIVVSKDCGTEKSLTIRSIIEGSTVIDKVSERVLGRVCAKDVMHPKTKKTILKKGQIITEHDQDILEESSINSLDVYSVLTCESKVGVCSKCYGRNLSQGHLVNIGEAVGIIAAQSIGEPGTQLTMRTFHIGGVAQGRAQESSIVSDYNGVAKLVKCTVIKDKENRFVVTSRNGVLKIIDTKDGGERAHYPLQYGARLTVNDGASVTKGSTIAEWDPYTTPIITEREGVVNYVDLVEGDSLMTKIDENTGTQSSVVVQPRTSDLKPRITLRDDTGNVIKLNNSMDARYFLAEGAILSVNDGQEVSIGDVLARVPREISKTHDITGGLPRVVEFFEARKPKNAAVIASIDGYVKFGKNYKTKRRISIDPIEGDPVIYPISKSRHIVVNENDFVRKGDVLVDGAPLPHDILDVLGVEALTEYLVQGVQTVYRLQGVKIDDKHIEVIIRQMLQKVEVVDPGESYFVVGEEVDRVDVAEVNEKLISEGKKSVVSKPILHGITKASLRTRSFISAAAFQETSRIFTDAAVYGKVDTLSGLKENVIVGRLIPAGTGLFIKDVQRRAGDRDKQQAEIDQSKATVTTNSLSIDAPK